MKIYLAGSPGGGYKENPCGCKIEKELEKLFLRRLWTYYYLRLRKDITMRNAVKLFLDSGAFSAWTQKIEININDYIDFIKEHKEHIEVYANLDVIGDADATLKNQRKMEKAGLDPIPCYHFGEPWDFLKMYVEDYEYIALGGIAVKRNKQSLISWLDECFRNFICDEKGFPTVKTHGFGLTSLPLMLRYPWYSVDSTSWVITGRMGSIYVPRLRKGKWIYDEQSWKVVVSSRAPTKKDTGRHIETYSPKQKQIIVDYIEEKGFLLGKSEFKMEDEDYTLKDDEIWAGKVEEDGSREVEVVLEDGLSNRYKLRDEINIKYFVDLEKSIKKYPWAMIMNRSQGFNI